MTNQNYSIDAQILYNFAERGEMVDVEALQAFGKNFFTKIKAKNIHKRVAGYTNADKEEKRVFVCELPQDMLAWAAFLYCFDEREPLDDDRIQERYGLNAKIYETLHYVTIMEKYSHMKAKEMEILDLEDIMMRATVEIRKYKGIE